MTFEHALGIAHAYLNRRERTEHEMREHLLRRGAAPELAEDVLRELTELGHLDDARFARLFVQDRRELDQWGSGRIRRGLIERGIPRDLIEATMGEGEATQPDELQRALALLHRRFPTRPRGALERTRALGILLRRGYDYDLAVDALAAHGRGESWGG